MLKDKHDCKGSDGTKSDYDTNMYDWANDKALREVLEKIINFVDIEIVICGQWIWVSGNTYPYKKELKELGFKWASKKKQWHFHTDLFRKKSRKVLSMDEIMDYYCSTIVNTTQRKQLVQA